jgi:hypothetical protein
MGVLQHAEATNPDDFSGLSDLVTIVPVEHVLHRDDA